MPSADQIADAYQKAVAKAQSVSTVANLTPPSGDKSPSSLFGQLLNWATNAGGVATKSVVSDVTTFYEQDIIKPLETWGKDVYNVGDLGVDAVRKVFDFGKNVNTTVTTVNDLGKKAQDTIDSLNQLVKNLSTGQGINLNLGGLGAGSPVDLSGIQSQLQNLMGNTNAVTNPSGGTDNTSWLLIGGAVVGVGLVVYFLARKR
jgi:hypothetical protein